MPPPPAVPCRSRTREKTGAGVDRRGGGAGLPGSLGLPPTRLALLCPPRRAPSFARPLPLPLRAALGLRGNPHGSPRPRPRPRPVRRGNSGPGCVGSWPRAGCEAGESLSWGDPPPRPAESSPSRGWGGVGWGVQRGGARLRPAGLPAGEARGRRRKWLGRRASAWAAGRILPLPAGGSRRRSPLEPSGRKALPASFVRSGGIQAVGRDPLGGSQKAGSRPWNLQTLHSFCEWQQVEFPRAAACLSLLCFAQGFLALSGIFRGCAGAAVPESPFALQECHCITKQ